MMLARAASWLQSGFDIPRVTIPCEVSKTEPSAHQLAAKLAPRGRGPREASYAVQHPCSTSHAPPAGEHEDQHDQKQ
jgi:hypothetical protein